MISMLLLAFLLPAFVRASLPRIETRGNGFFPLGSDSRFYIRGLDYQPGGSSKLFDPLADPLTCERDIAQFKDLGINTIRVYSIDNTADHDECMQMLDDAGIYLILDVNIPNALIARDDGANCSYNTMYLNEVFATMTMMSQYNNTLGFFAANEVINDVDTTPAATVVKAVVRDMKNFQRGNNLPLIPVGYSAADVESNRLESALFFNCGDDDMARVDMYGFNDYSWCGLSSFTRSGYDQKVKAYGNYSVPIFFSEFGCNKVTPRGFTEVKSIYSSDMTHVFSGGLVYEYSQEANNYGLVEISDDNKTVTPNQDYDNLKLQFAAVPNPTGNGDYQEDLPHNSCPPLSSTWEASSTLPDTPKGALKYINGVAAPEGNGFDAITQWACIAAGNDVDDSDDYSSSSKGSSSTKSGSSSSSSKSGSSSSSSSSSSSKQNIGAVMQPSVLTWIVTMVLALAA